MRPRRPGARYLSHAVLAVRVHHGRTGPDVPGLAHLGKNRNSACMALFFTTKIGPSPGRVCRWQARHVQSRGCKESGYMEDVSVVPTSGGGVQATRKTEGNNDDRWPAWKKVRPDAERRARCLPPNAPACRRRRVMRASD